MAITPRRGRNAHASVLRHEVECRIGPGEGPQRMDEPEDVEHRESYRLQEGRNEGASWHLRWSETVPSRLRV
ncbi:hypothetical protein GCM10011581_35290 [Saccharopolyspora subtropica]|uniref:Uncharacterized protein n=1 Tax=Saccharopolyspora thermophila TaxID=89367 RepID=A0A917JZZ2_9PSEU|nr:hypothetical protein GCM10011581_35290 [Saccharopolyspora subtropica]